MVTQTWGALSNRKRCVCGACEGRSHAEGQGGEERGAQGMCMYVHLKQKRHLFDWHTVWPLPKTALLGHWNWRCSLLAVIKCM